MLKTVLLIKAGQYFSPLEKGVGGIEKNSARGIRNEIKGN